MAASSSRRLTLSCNAASTAGLHTIDALRNSPMSYHLSDPRAARRRVRGTLRPALLSRTAWRRLAGWLVLALTPTLLGVTLTGCSVCWQLQRTLIKEPLQYGWKRDRKRSLQVYRTWAEEAYRAVCPQLDLPDVLEAEYGLGFRDGFVDYVHLGGTGNPPPVPPRKFWNVESRVTDVRTAAEQWCAGYRHGAKVARDGGYRDLALLPTGCLTGCELEPNAYVQSPLPVRPLHRAPDELRQPESLEPPLPTPAAPPALPTPPDGDVVEIKDTELRHSAARSGFELAVVAEPPLAAAPSTMATPWASPPAWANAPRLDLRGLLPSAAEIAIPAVSRASAPTESTTSTATPTSDVTPRLVLATPLRSTLTFAKADDQLAESSEPPSEAPLLLAFDAEIVEPSEVAEIEEGSDARGVAEPPLKLLAGAESSSVNVVLAAPGRRSQTPAAALAKRPPGVASPTTVAAQQTIGGQPAPPQTRSADAGKSLDGSSSPPTRQPVAPPTGSLEFLR
jgi:hypothetical protein